jgi:hypothetical protein
MTETQLGEYGPRYGVLLVEKAAAAPPTARKGKVQKIVLDGLAQRPQLRARDAVSKKPR